jgi:phage gpG-like protein
MAFKTGAVKVLDKLPKLLAAMNSLTMKDVMVGIPKEETARDDTGPLNNATIGYIMEHGAPEANIPARPFLIPGVEACKDKVAKQLAGAAKGAVQGNAIGIEEGLERAGLLAQNSVRAKINSGIGPSLAPSTIAARKRRGRTGTKPLIDTGQLRNSITYVVRSK